MTGRKTVLIVEDEPMIGMMLEDFLDELDYACAGVVSSVEEGIAAARSGGFDAAILDCNIVGGKVWPVASVLADGDIPFLFATGGSADEVPAEHAGRPTLGKPFTLGSVEQALELLLND